MSEQIVQLNGEAITGRLKESVQESAEETYWRPPLRTPPLRADFIYPRDCKPICAKLLTLPSGGASPGLGLSDTRNSHPESIPSGSFL